MCWLGNGIVYISNDHVSCEFGRGEKKNPLRISNLLQAEIAWSLHFDSIEMCGQ